MSQLLRNVAALWAAGATLGPAVTEAANVRGSIETAPATHLAVNIGYTRTKVVSPGKLVGRTADTAVFLKVKSSLPLPAPTSLPIIHFAGFQLSPEIATCAVDGKVTLANDDRTALTVKIGDVTFATLQPGESKDYECVVGKAAEDVRTVQVVQWPYARASVYVGEVGVAGQLNDKGGFVLPGSPGKYELQVVSNQGVVLRKEVDLGKADVDLGTIDLTTPKAEEKSGSP